MWKICRSPLYFVLFSFGAAANPQVLNEKCSQRVDLLSKNSLIYNKYAATMGDPMDLIRCREGYEKHIKFCDNELRKNKFCGQDLNELKSTEGSAIPDKSKISIKIHVNRANCFYALSSCYRMGNDYKEKRQELEAQCFHKQKEVEGMALEDSATRTKAADPRSLKLYTSDVYSQVLNPESSCWERNANSYEHEAKIILQGAKNCSTEEQRAGMAINCIDHDNGNRVCVFHESGGSRLTEYTDERTAATAAAEGNVSTANLELDECSGTVLGDGLTVVTAGHCTKNIADGKTEEREISAYDKNGQIQKLTAICGRGVYSQNTAPDISICKLSRKIEAADVSAAFYDSNVKGSECQRDEYIWRCGDEYFQNKTKKVATMYAFPRQFDPNNNTVRANMVRTTGTLIYDPLTKNLTYDMLCTGGCSGAGVIINENGRNVLLAADNYGSRYEASGGSSTVPYETYKNLKLQSISTEKLTAGSELFQQMPFQ